MKTLKQNTVWLLVLIVATSILNLGCEKKEEVQKKPELLVYCGITMIAPMAEIAAIIEKQENCKITITKGGSGNLLKSIKANKMGDLYLPGSDSYIKICQEEGLVTDAVFVGYNKAAIMVQEGNPKNITADLDNLTSKDYYVVIGNPKSGSIGRETKKILDAKGIFDAVINNSRKLTTDSKDLALVLKNQEADIVINWYAACTWPEYKDYVDALPIDEQYATKKKLTIGLLTYSKYPEIARKIMAFAASEQGKDLFNKFGLYDIE